MKDPYPYDNGVLKNKLDIRDQEKLRIVEGVMTFEKLLSVDTLYQEGKKIDFEYMKKLHRYIFEDLYDFAGKTRTVMMGKPELILDGKSVEYAAPKIIEEAAQAVMNQMDSISWGKLNLLERAYKFSVCISGLWQVHPFREGNTRTTMIFATHYAESHGFFLEKQIFRENAALTRNSLVLASKGEYDFLTGILGKGMQLGENKAITSELKHAGFQPTEQLIREMKKLNYVCGCFVTVKELRNMYKKMAGLDPEVKESVVSAAKEFKEQEKKLHKESKGHIPEL